MTDHASGQPGPGIGVELGADHVATIEFSKVFRLITNSTYRTTYNRAAMLRTSTLRNCVVRTIGADGPVREVFSAAAGAWSMRSAKPQRGITA